MYSTLSTSSRAGLTMFDVVLSWSSSQFFCFLDMVACSSYTHERSQRTGDSVYKAHLFFEEVKNLIAKLPPLIRHILLWAAVLEEHIVKV